MRSPLLKGKHASERDRRRLFIEGYSFPHPLRERLREEYEPQLADSQLTLILEGLRSWFGACLYAPGEDARHAVDGGGHCLARTHPHDACGGGGG